MKNKNHSIEKPTILPSRPGRRPLKLLIVISAMLGIFFMADIGGHVYAHQKTPSIVVQRQATLKTQLSSIITKQPYAIGVAIEDTSTRDVTTIGSTQPFVAASTGKILTACAFYHLVETGQASLTQPIGSWSASYQIEEMINDSDNDSWQQLEEAVTLPVLDSYASSIGVAGYDATTNMITPAEMADVLSNLYAGKLLNASDTRQLLSYMQNTNMEQMIPSVTPPSIDVYHKYGLLNGALHDVAILADGSHSYALTIYTQNSDDSDDLERISVIREIAQSTISNLFPGVQPLQPAAPTEIDD